MDGSNRQTLERHIGEKMIIRVSAKLGKKIHVSPKQSLPLNQNPYADWSADLFTADRTQYILLTNTASLYSMVMYGRGITTDSRFLRSAIRVIGEVLRDDGHQFIFERLVAPNTGQITFSKALNRSVTGSMSDLGYQAKGHLIEGQMSPFDCSFRLHEIPMGQLKYDKPREAFLKLALQSNGHPNS
jgi:hypothetical protein